ncbi:hypothetical protein ACUVJI_04625 [Vibrio parahaemolyticus]|uniref:hypothetical protein n=1 Tax=Vibrio parahaemolyticus TaxID=670 RepID=UPI001FAB58B1|nr:hypothetical protein [Vibrio parahaemolyticus]
MSVFISPRLKVERACKHIQELESITFPLSKELYEIKVEAEFAFPRPDAIGMSLVYRPTQPIAETLGLIIGDVISNFRAALDHLASGIVREVDSTKRPYFPMSDSREELSKNRFLPILDAALPGASELLLGKLRPEGGGDELYWLFHSMDNDSKHNIILPTVSAVNIENINLTSGGMTMTNCGVGGDATKQINLLRTGGEPIRIQNTFDVSVELSFPSESIFPNLPVIRTLQKIGEIVTLTINEFEKLYTINKADKVKELA